MVTVANECGEASAATEILNTCETASTKLRLQSYVFLITSHSKRGHHSPQEDFLIVNPSCRHKIQTALHIYSNCPSLYSISGILLLQLNPESAVVQKPVGITKIRALAWSNQPTMCIAQLIEFDCGHAKKEYMNQHCICPLVIRLVTSSDQCPRGCVPRVKKPPLPGAELQSKPGAIGSRSSTEWICGWLRASANL